MLSSADIKSAAATVGFDRCGIARATAVSGQRAAELRAWLAEGCHGEMDYLGMYCRRDTGKKEEFMDEKTEFDVRDFAHALYITVGHSM